jgi:hypothetical protein
MKAFIAAMLALWSCAAASADYVDEIARSPSYKVFFPPFKRVETETGSGRVTAIEVVVHCGEITGVARIPADWSVEVHRPISGESRLVAGAGHGVTYLWKLETWNGSIRITPYDMSCFNVEAVVTTDGPDEDKDRKISYTRKQLRLRP